MVNEETMRKIKFFKYLGAFSVHQQSRQIVQSLQFAAQLLQQPQNLVVVFPQGKLYSNFAQQLQVAGGAFKIGQLAGTNKFQYIMVASFTENMQHRKPTAQLYLINYPGEAFATAQQLNSTFNTHYLQAWQQQSSINV